MLLIASVCQLQAQETNIKKRSWVVGGGGSFSTNGLFGDRANSNIQSRFNFSPYVGKELSKHWMIGAEFLFSNSKQIRSNIETTPGTFVASEANSRHLGAGLFARYTINPSDKLNFFVQPYANYARRTGTLIYDDVISHSTPFNTFETGVKAGLLYNINERFRLKMDIGGAHFRTNKTASPNLNYQGEFRSNFGLSNIGIGIEMKF